MISLKSNQLKSTQCKNELDEFESLLKNNSEIDETQLLNFFKSRPQLILLMGRVVGIDAPRNYNNELPLIGKFRADFVVANGAMQEFVFIEFEDAKDNSIFTKKINKKTSVHSWAARFEKGYSQVVDWYLHLAANNQTQNMKSEFGHFEIKYKGALIIGRQSSLSRGDCNERFEQRRSKSLIDSKHITCYTFDELYEAMADQYAILESF
ncbi:Shedu anti-phage system protein SduA domain-containing protein [Photobacterium sp. S4TG1]|uniref:Shedu anti-phage system protein SduA domain-containing protein n=1 Tax=Photobacterium sp. S4TG1 TaxID=3114587 RepID=UPI002E17FDC5|nr:Shedu anti-phage system protein SduA domain-containing protein [Photobacterium sp. S4TG1]